MAIKFPPNHGKKWHIDEFRTLDRRLRRGFSISQIAKLHGRIEIAISCAIDRMWLHRLDIADSVHTNEWPSEKVEEFKPDSRLIINGKNYDILLDRVHKIVQHKIVITATLGGS